MEYKYNYEEPQLNPVRQILELSISPIRLIQFGMVNKKLNDFYKKNGITNKDIDIKNCLFVMKYVISRCKNS